ncbi:MAG: ABC transporter ATP-binding protein [Victivallaceae bacterium]|nr:ABC transporter ATP-binding protein [Victivallaceae bacterium]
MKTILATDKLDFGYNSTSLLLNNFNFGIAEESFTALIGPNGSGKTTVFNLLTGYLNPLSGSVEFHGKSLKQLSLRKRASMMAVVPQSINSALPYTVYQLVAMGRISRLSRFAILSKDDKTQIEYAMDVMDVTALREQQFNCLSGGEQQRTVIAAALAQEPKVLLLDEPTSSLDLGHGNSLMRLLRQLNRDKKLTIMIISHDIQLAAHYCQRLTLMKDGKIIADGTPDTVIKPEHIMEAYNEPVNIIRDDNGNLLLSPNFTDSK